VVDPTLHAGGVGSYCQAINTALDTPIQRAGLAGYTLYWRPF